MRFLGFCNLKIKLNFILSTNDVANNIPPKLLNPFTDHQIKENDREIQKRKRGEKRKERKKKKKSEKETQELFTSNSGKLNKKQVLNQLFFLE